MVPNSLADWTYATIATLCAAGQGESERHDFKARLPEAQILTKLCCAFANSDGGFVTVGVNEGKIGAFEPIGIDPDTELYGKFLQKVRATPDVPIADPKRIEVPHSKKFLYVFEIRRSLRSPHLPVAVDERTFWKRQGPSCVQMTLEEIRAQMNSYEEKREKLALLLLDIQYKVQSLNEENKLPDMAYSTELFGFEIIDRVVVETFSYLKADSEILNNLNTFKRRLSELNGKKQKLLSMLALTEASKSDLHSQSVRRVYRSDLQSVMHQLTNIADQIERSITAILEPGSASAS